MKKSFEMAIACVIGELRKKITKNFTNSTTVEYKNQGLMKEAFIETHFSDKDGKLKHSSLISLN